ncbi:hypothetical protein LTR53_001937 [Teratosphaeriaceae sp. CCFEE 6253]|nr:hypothetical protein LTR53_001937 [Teratosphaeriaceae sp. CCFEE 6253]
MSTPPAPAPTGSRNTHNTHASPASLTRPMATPTPNAQNQSRLSDAEKKRNHIVSEAKRREAIREQFVNLANLVPGMEGQGRSEAMVLQATVDYMREQLTRKEELRERAIRNGMSNEEFESHYKHNQPKKSPGRGDKNGGGTSNGSGPSSAAGGRAGI